MRLISSELALRAILALRQSGPAGLAAVAGFLDTGTSSMQRALGILTGDAVVRADDRGRARTYRLREGSPLVEHLVPLAEAAVAPREALAIVARANPAVEFLAIDANEVVAVFRKHSRALEQSRAAGALAAIAGRAGLGRRLLYHEDIRSQRGEGREMRDRLAAADIVHGALDVSFPDRSQHGRGAGTFLGRVNPALRLPSRRTLSTIKRRHGVRTLRVFGSAVRSSFRPDSDVDVAVALAPGAGLTSDARALLEEELERCLQRDVDVVLEAALRPPVRELVERESVAL